MKILEYDEVDPLQVLNLTLPVLDSPLTPERAAHIRRTDPRPFPFFTINAVENGRVLGQAGVFRLPMVSTYGSEAVGGVWAVSTLPGHARSEVVSELLKEAHARMRDAGLRFSMLTINRADTLYGMYQTHGYGDMQVHATALAAWEMAHQPTRLCAQPASEEGYEIVEKIFTDISRDFLGFARHPAPFAPLRQVNLLDIWILQENGQPVGYAFADTNPIMLTISSLALRSDTGIVEAVAAIAAESKSDYVRVEISRPVEIGALRNAGYQVNHPSWDAFMIHPLTPDVTGEDARRLFGIGTDRFMISWLDVT